MSGEARPGRVGVSAELSELPGGYRLCPSCERGGLKPGRPCPVCGQTADEPAAEASRGASVASRRSSSGGDGGSDGSSRRNAFQIAKEEPEQRRVTVTIEGEPVPKQRPRVRVSDDPDGDGKRAHGFTPQRTRQYARWVSSQASLQVPIGHEPLVGPVSATVTILTRRPAGQSDIDNVAKGALDALNGWLWHDDAQIDELVVRRFRRFDGDPRVIVTATGFQTSEVAAPPAADAEAS